MSLYYSPHAISEPRLKSVARELARELDTTVLRSGTGGFLWVGRDQRRFGPAYDPKTGVHLICSGQLAWPANDWSRAERLPFEGGIGPRLLLERYLSGGIDAVVPYNGSTIVVVHDPRSAEHHICTDQFGYHPCFVYRGDDAGASIISTFPDTFLADPELELTYDLVSMAEFVRAWRTTPPHTYFTQVKYLGAATRLTLHSSGARIAKYEYWKPFEEGFFRSIEEASEVLATAVKTAIMERTAAAERPLLFISGGADSRVMLFSTTDPAKITGVNIFEHTQQETEIARNLCRVAGTKFVALQRDNDYYPRNLPEIVRWSGGMWSAEDSHYPGFEEELADSAPDLVMTACTTDWLFKGYGLEKRHASIFGRNLPFLRYLDQRADGFLPNVPLSAPSGMAAEIQARMEAWFVGCPNKLASPEDRLIVEDRRVRPACYTVSVSGQIMYRIFPYDTFMADSRIADCYSRIHPDWKLNREVWGKAVARICSGAGNIVDANYGWRVGAGAFEKAVAFSRGWVGRRLSSKIANNPPPTDRPPAAGSWPDYRWYAKHSKTVGELWYSATHEERERMRAITGFDHWASPVEDWQADGNQLFRLLTLLCHWRECDRRRGLAGLSRLKEPAS
jgi:asparagine synthase (glutamine-hydrolysing)